MRFCKFAAAAAATKQSALYDRRMVVESLSHQLQRQLVPHAARLLHLGALVLEPDFDLRLVELQLAGERLAPFLRQVLARIELTF